MSEAKVKSLSDFTLRVASLRAWWQLPPHKELWFRGETRRHDTLLRPELYRPERSKSLRPIDELLTIENDLYEYFQRCAVQLSGENATDDDWDWDSYFLMQHHSAPTRLLDWSDGALIALHFAVKSKGPSDTEDSFVYVLEPCRMKEHLPEDPIVKDKWRASVEKHSTEGLSPDHWERCWLPTREEDLKEVDIPIPPLLLNFPHITRRIAAQRSQFMVFGRDPGWLADRLGEIDFPMAEIVVDAGSSFEIRTELRDSGITESVIFPDLDGLGRELRQVWEDRRASPSDVK